jgi:hypothetical protein
MFVFRELLHLRIYIYVSTLVMLESSFVSDHCHLQGRSALLFSSCLGLLILNAAISEIF